MQPIGLTFKKQKQKYVSTYSNSELMIVHRCLSCGKISTNRIAGDDNGYVVVNIFTDSLSLDENIRIKAADLTIYLLTMEDKELMLRSLFGNNYSQFTE